MVERTGVIKRAYDSDNNVEKMIFGQGSILEMNGDFVGPNPSGGQDYFVDGNKSTTGSYGLSWSDAFKTIAEAIAASDISIALTANRWWARRNRIFVSADTLTETLVKFPTKCDVIGVGSYDANSMPGIVGHHAPVGECYGCRFINIKFNGVATATPIFTLTSATSGLQFHGCIFDGTAGTMTIGIQATASPFLVVNDCDFVGTFVTSYMTFGTGQAGRTRISNNRMLGTAAKGIVAGSGMISTWRSLIDNNIIFATGLVIDDDSDLFIVTNNLLYTDADPTADSTGAVDCLHDTAINNFVSSSAGTERNSAFPFKVEFTS